MNASLGGAREQATGGAPEQTTGSAPDPATVGPLSELQRRGFVFVVGMTGSGKSSWAVEAAQRCTQIGATSILNADSIQLYTDLNVGSAKPSTEERQVVPHFLFDLVSAPEEMNLGDYHRQFFGLLEGPQLRPGLHFVVGGTGFYLQALEKGLWQIPKANHQRQAQLQERLQNEGEDVLFQELKALDPDQAAKIHAHDHYRLVRFLDMALETGRKPSEIYNEHAAKASTFPEPLLKIGFRLSQQELRPRLEQRARLMLKHGLLDEVSDLCDRGFAAWPPLQSVGYRETLAFLQGSAGGQDIDRLVSDIVSASLRLAKKQRTWFQRDPEIQWFHPLQKDEAFTALEQFTSALES